MIKIGAGSQRQGKLLKNFGSVPVAPTLPLTQVSGDVSGAPTELPMERSWEQNQRMVLTHKCTSLMTWQEQLNVNKYNVYFLYD